MSTRTLLAVTVLVLAAVVWMRDVAEGPPPPPARARPLASRPVGPAGAQPSASARNVFEYAARDVPDPPSRAAAPVALDAPPVVVPSPITPPVRLLGLVRRGGTLKAALQVDGESVTVGKGEAAGGYTVEAIDDDGVRLRAADGTILTLATGGS